MYDIVPIVLGLVCVCVHYLSGQLDAIAFSGNLPQASLWIVLPVFDCCGFVADKVLLLYLHVLRDDVAKDEFLYLSFSRRCCSCCCCCCCKRSVVIKAKLWCTFCWHAAESPCTQTHCTLFCPEEHAPVDLQTRMCCSMSPAVCLDLATISCERRGDKTGRNAAVCIIACGLLMKQ